MAFDSEERKRRRQQLQKKRQQEQKKLMIGLVVAAVVLVACGILIAVIALRAPRQKPQETQPSTEPPQIQQTQTTEAPTEPAANTTVIRIAAAGDVNVSDKTVASCNAGYDYTNAFVDVLPLLSEADLTLLNFEGNLCGQPYGTASVSAPQEMLEALHEAGVDLVQMANSRCISNGMSGLATTLQNIRAAGLTPVGAYATEREFKESGGYIICNIKGVRVAFVAFTKGMDGMALPAGSENCVNLLYKDYSTMYKEVDTAGITKRLRAVAKEKPDITIALLHWGSEYSDKENKTQETIKNLMLSEGVDAIIGTHPHYVQKMELDEEAGTFVAYSLGDFFSDAERAGSEYSLVLQLEITKNNSTGVTKITGFDYTPIFNLEGTDGKMRVVRLQEQLDQYLSENVRMVTPETYSKMVYGMKRVHERVGVKVEEPAPDPTEGTQPTETTGATETTEATETTAPVETTAETTESTTVPTE